MWKKTLLKVLAKAWELGYAAGYSDRDVQLYAGSMAEVPGAENPYLPR